MWEMTRSILRGWFQRELSCRPGCWRCHDSCIPAGRPCWLSWLKVSEDHGDRQSCSVLFHPCIPETLPLSWIWFNGSFKTVCELRFILLRWRKSKVLTVWKFRTNLSHQLLELMEVDAQLCDQRWKESSDYCTVAWICDGFYCEGMPLRHSGSATESFSSQLSPSGVQIPGFHPCVWQKALMASRQRRKSSSSWCHVTNCRADFDERGVLSPPQIIFIVFHIASDLPTLADDAVDSLQPFIIFHFSRLGFLHNPK